MTTTRHDARPQRRAGAAPGVAEAGPRRWRLSGRGRKAVLLVHVAVAGTWLGVDVVLGVLVLTAATSDDAVAPAAALVSVAEFATTPLVVVAALTLASGVLLGLGTKYGLVRYWWVAVKLVLNLVLVGLVLGLLGPAVTAVAADARDTLAAGGPPPEVGQLAFPPIVSTTAVLIAFTLSVFKPWGRVRRSTPTADRTGGIGRTP